MAIQTDLINLIKVYPNVVPQHLCDRIITEFESHSDEFVSYDTQLYKFTQLYFNETDLQDLSGAFINQIIPYINDYFKSLNLNEYINVEAFEDVRIKRYKKSSGEKFNTHIDVSCKESSKRFLAALLYLNDNNGNTVFPLLNYSIKPTCGSLLLFPPMWMFPHSGNEPTDNDKYVLMTFLNYP